jgi:hypothetical protein
MKETLIAVATIGLAVTGIVVIALGNTALGVVLTLPMLVYNK